MTRSHTYLLGILRTTLGLGALGILLPSCSGHAIRDIQHIGSSDTQAVYYALPRTVLTLEVQGEKTKKSKDAACRTDLNTPIACDYKGTIPMFECLGVPDPTTEPGESWSFEDPALGQRAEPDPDEIFRVEISASALKKTGIGLNLSQEGLITRGESSFQDRRLDIAVASLQSAASLVAPFQGLRELAVAPTPLTCVQMAEKILELRQQAVDLLDAIDADSPVAADALQLRLDSLEARQNALLANFRSKKGAPKKGRIYCEYIPGATGGNKPLLRLSKTEGAAEVTAGDCLIPEALAATTTPSAATSELISLDLTKDTNQLSEVLRAKIDAVDRTKDQGFYYRVPANITVDVLKTTTGPAEILTRTTVAVAQAGIVTALPKQRTSQSAYIVDFYENTGAIKTLSATSEAIDTSLLTDSAEAISGVIERDRASEDELEILTRQRKILEETKKIRDYEKELADQSDGSP